MSQLPLCGSATTTPRPSAKAASRLSSPWNDVVELAGQRAVVHRRQPERLSPVAAIGRQRGAHQRVRHLGGPHTDDAGQVLAQLVGPAVAGRVARSGVECVARGELRQRPHRHPAGRVRPVGRRARPKGCGAPRAISGPPGWGSLLVSLPSPGRAIRSVAPGEVRTVYNRCPQVITLATASTHIATGSAGGQCDERKMRSRQRRPAR